MFKGAVDAPATGTAAVSAPAAAALRVCQLNAARLEEGLLKTLRASLSELVAALPASRSRAWLKAGEPELHAGLLALVLTCTVGRGSATFSQRLYNLRYAWRASPTATWSPPSQRRMGGYIATLVACHWLAGRVPRLMLTFGWNTQPPGSLRRRLYQLWERLQRLLAVAEFVNRFVFIVRGRHADLVGWLFGLRLVYADEHGKIPISYHDVSRTLLWQAIGEALVLAGPVWVQVPRLWSNLTTVHVCTPPLAPFTHHYPTSTDIPYHLVSLYFPSLDNYAHSDGSYRPFFAYSQEFAARVCFILSFSTMATFVCGQQPLAVVTQHNACPLPPPPQTPRCVVLSRVLHQQHTHTPCIVGR